MNYEVEKDKMSEKILAVCCTDKIYIGLGNKLFDYTTKQTLCQHEKSIRCISFNDEFLGCCSYDGSASIFCRDGQFKERIEGPDTEIKGIAFDRNFIALTTRGKTTWVLEDFEISKILEDHTQDVKGCCFASSRLYTWSYDGSIKVYNLFDIGHSWELTQSIDLGSIVWSVVFFADYMCATLHNGDLAFLKLKNGLWVEQRRIRASITPIYCATVAHERLAVVCNRNCVVLFDKDLNKQAEISDLNDGFDIFCCGFYEPENILVLGSEDGTLTKVKLDVFEIKDTLQRF